MRQDAAEHWGTPHWRKFLLIALMTRSVDPPLQLLNEDLSSLGSAQPEGKDSWVLVDYVLSDYWVPTEYDA